MNFTSWSSVYILILAVCILVFFFFFTITHGGLHTKFGKCSVNSFALPCQKLWISFIFFFQFVATVVSCVCHLPKCSYGRDDDAMEN